MEYYHRNEWPWGKTTIINICDGAATVKVTVENSNSDVAFISSLSVVPDKRHCGFGHNLLGLAELEAKNMGCTHVELWAVIGEFTVGWYQREGYHIINKVEGHYRMGRAL